jgi:hypothetical protein
LEELKKNYVKLNENSLYPGRDLNPGSPEHEARVLPPGLWSSLVINEYVGIWKEVTVVNIKI